MRTTRRIAGWLWGLTALALIIAGPVMIYRGVDGQSQVRDQLSAQQIQFPAKDAIPADLVAYANQKVTTGPQAKAYADMVEEHILKATGGKTYSQVSAAYIASGSKDTKLAGLRQTAFMGESLRGSLMSAYQAWELTWLVIGLGALLTGLAVVAGATGLALRPKRITVPASPEALETRDLAHH